MFAPGADTIMTREFSGAFDGLYYGLSSLDLMRYLSRLAGDTCAFFEIAIPRRVRFIEIWPPFTGGASSMALLPRAHYA